jgi:Na+-transporting NADH:ubiquinone oxidoreductase subunit A
MDSNPLAPLPEVVLSDRFEEFDRGLNVIAKLTEGETFLCQRSGSTIASAVRAPVTVEEFAGPHPAGTAGLHVHLVKPVSRARTVWTIGYQDVVAIGRLFATGQLDVSRVVALGGPGIDRPRLIETRMGARVADLFDANELGDDVRPISGSVFSGKAAIGEAFGFLGRYDNQVSVLAEGREREFMGWMGLGFKRFSVIPIFLSKFFRPRQFEFTTSTNGSPRAMVPIGMYERVMPFDILPTMLLRALVVEDTEAAEQLGCLELAEEDLALCTFVDPGKVDYGPLLRQVLTTVEHDG